MAAITNRPAAGVRADYAVFVPIGTRWTDNDAFGHVNSTVYYSFFDTAVCKLLVDAGILSGRGSAHILVVAESGCRYISEVAFPDQVTAGIRIARIGTSSVRYEIGIFRHDADEASAEGFMVHVCVDADHRRAAPMPDAWRTAFTRIGE